MKDITKRLISGGCGLAAMALVGALLGRKDDSKEETANEIMLDEDLVPEKDSETEEGTEEEKVEE